MNTLDQKQLLHHIRTAQQSARQSSDTGHASFEHIWQACFPYVKSIIAYFYVSEAEAEDLIQETCITLWKILPKFDPERSSITTFASLIAKNRTLDLIREKTRRDKKHSAYEVLLNLGLTQHNSGSNTASRDEYTLLLRLIKMERKENVKEIARLVSSGCSYPEIAKKLGVNVSTVKTQWRRFRTKFKKLYADRFAN